MEYEPIMQFGEQIGKRLTFRTDYDETIKEFREGRHIKSIRNGKEFYHSNENANIGVWGDLHGNFDYACNYMNKWEKETGRTIDYIFQVGDFIDGSVELNHNPWFFSRDIKMFFTHGNHDMFWQSEKTEAVDDSERFIYVANGNCIVGERKKRVKFMFMGGLFQKGYNLLDIREAMGKNPDVLVSHEPGQAIKELISHIKPKYHFAGHYHEEGRLMHQINETKTYLLNHIAEGNINSMGVLEYSDNDSFFEFI